MNAEIPTPLTAVPAPGRLARSGEAPRVRASIVVPVKDDARIFDVVAALERDLPAGVEILVADDGRPGGLTRVGGALVVPVHGRNPGAARNAAARLARGDVLLFTDADVVLPPGWVASALRRFEDPAVEALQGDTRAAGRRSIARHVDRQYARFVESHSASGYGDLCDTRCFGIRREIFDRAGFDSGEAFCEDAAFGRHLFETGVRILFDREWVVGHHVRPSFAGEIDRWRTYAASSERHLRRTGRDLFQAPSVTVPPKGPGATALRWTKRAPGLAVPAARAARAAARILGRLSSLPLGIGDRCFDTATRLAILSGRMHPEDAIAGDRRASRGAGTGPAQA